MVWGYCHGEIKINDKKFTSFYLKMMRLVYNSNYFSFAFSAVCLVLFLLLSKTENMKKHRLVSSNLGSTHQTKTLFPAGEALPTKEHFEHNAYCEPLWWSLLTAPQTGTATPHPLPLPRPSTHIQE